MVIDPNNIANTGSAGAKSKSASAEPAAGLSKQSPKSAPSVPSTADSVSLSAEAQSLGKVESAIAASPEIDSAKVDSVRSAIQSGQYQIDAEAIAEAIVSQELI